MPTLWVKIDISPLYFSYVRTDLNVFSYNPYSHTQTVTSNLETDGPQSGGLRYLEFSNPHSGVIYNLGYLDQAVPGSAVAPFPYQYNAGLHTSFIRNANYYVNSVSTYDINVQDIMFLDGSIVETYIGNDRPENGPQVAFTYASYDYTIIETGLDYTGDGAIDPPRRYFQSSGDTHNSYYLDYIWLPAGEIDGPIQPLFTPQADTVNFNSLSESQKAALKSGANPYAAIGGDDVVTLPNTAAAATAAGYFNSNPFNGGAGNDTITGGALNDSMMGGDDNDTLNGFGGNDKLYGDNGNDIINGGAGDDRLNGDAGIDTLDGAAGDDKLNGGDGNDTLKGGTGDAAGRDVLWGGKDNDILIGGPGKDELFGEDGNDTFDFQTNGLSGWTVGTKQIVDGGDNATGGVDLIKLPGKASDYKITVDLRTTWEGTSTKIEKIGAGGTVEYTFDTRLAEKAVFTSGVTTPDSDIAKGGDLLVELARLSKEVYGQWTPLEHTKENLANEQSGTPPYFNFAANAAARGWRPLSALELGIKPADFGEKAALRYSFVDGAYAAYNSGILSSLADTPEANAMVLSGIVNGVRTLTIAFRGTDQIADWLDYGDFDRHFSKFKPLVDALRDYIADSTNGIQQVLVTGHSLGGAMAQTLLRQAGFTGNNVKAFTFGSPGADLSLSNLTDPRIQNFVHTDDFVPLAGEPAGTAALTALAIRLGLATNLLLQPEPKDRVGPDIRINHAADKGFGLDEHSIDLYLESLQLLTLKARETGAFSKSSVAQSLRDGVPWSGTSIQIGLTTDKHTELQSGSDDEYVLGSASNDTISTGFGSFGIALQSIASNKGRVIDTAGGTKDSVVLANARDSYELRASLTGGTDILLNQSITNTKSLVATIFNVERLIWADGVTGAAGEVLTAQTPQSSGAGAPTFVINPTFDFADAGNGDLMVTGSSAADIVYLGSGKKTVSGGDGGDIILAKVAESTTQDVLKLNGDGGNDLLKGGRGADVLNGGADNDALNGEGGKDTINGGTGADILIGGADNDALYGGVGADTLQGGDGIDYARYDDANHGSLRISLSAPATNTGAAAGDTYSSIEGIIAGAGHDLVFGNSSVNYLYGLGGDDNLYGGLGADRLDGGANFDYARYDDANYGNLRISLTASNTNTGAAAVGDTYFGIEGIIAGAGADVLYGNASANTLNGNGGTDTLYGGLGADTLIGGADIDYARYDDASYGNLVISLLSPQFNTSAAAGDKFSGIEGIIAGAGNDRVDGNTFVNYLYGAGGNDTILGNLGNDTLSGGAGLDTFVFNTPLNAATNRDTILDFVAADDTIWIDRTYYGGLAVGALSAANFTVGAAAADASDRIIYNQATGALFFDADGTGATAQIQFATLSTRPAITAADFQVIA